MPQLPKSDIDRIVVKFRNSDTAYEKGKAFEDLICIIFQTVPGIEIARRNIMNTFHTEEVDIALWNNRFSEGGLDFLPNIILIECKNWSTAVGSCEVSYFKTQLENRVCDYGILIAANGITGNSEDLTNSHFIIASALSHKIRIIVITLDDLLQLENTEDLVRLIKEKLLDLTLKCTNT